LANLGFTASRERPSAEEMAKASRARAALGIVRRNDASLRSLIADLTALIDRAERVGLRAERAARWRRELVDGALSKEALLRRERRLRQWVLARSDPAERPSVPGRAP
jgi:hypothetical protein